MSSPVHFLFGGHAAIYTCLPCHFKSQRLLCLCANFDRSSRYMYFWNLIGFRRFFDIYISLLCSPWLPGHLYLSAARFILWAFFPRVFIYAWTLCSHFPHHELNCVFRIGPNVYRLLTTWKQKSDRIISLYILLFWSFIGRALMISLYIYNWLTGRVPRLLGRLCSSLLGHWLTSNGGGGGGGGATAATSSPAIQQQDTHTLKLNLPHLQGQKQEREATQDKNTLCIISYMHRLFVGYSLCVKELLLLLLYG